jgi:4a-hydroxytetrahydrobiopterin dehydratase
MTQGKTKRILLAKQELEDSIKRLPGWEIVNGKLHKEFQFESFVRAFGFMTSVAITAESMNHHPEWFNVYDKVRVDLITHDLGGISTFDVILAEQMNQLAESFS